MKQYTLGLLMIGGTWKRKHGALSSSVAGIHGVWDHNLAFVNSHLGERDVDSMLGEYCCFPLETTSILRPSILNKAMKTETRSRLRAGTPVYNSAWFCGTSMTHRYTLCTVREKSKRVIDGSTDMYYLTSCEPPLQCRRKRLGLHKIRRDTAAFRPPVG